MIETHHLQARMGQRGIKGAMVRLALEFGEIEQDRYILNRKACLNLIESLRAQQKALEHAASKGGIVVVSDNNVAITTYRAGSNVMKRRPALSAAARRELQIPIT